MVNLALLNLFTASLLFSLLSNLIEQYNKYYAEGFFHQNNNQTFGNKM